MNKELYMVYVEDDEDDLLLMEEIMLAQNKVNLVAVGDGLELLQFLSDQMDGELPCLVVLDNNTPRMSGIETAKKLKSNPHYANLTLILLTTSPSKGDEEYCRENNISIYTKPTTYADWETLSRTFISHCTVV